MNHARANPFRRRRPPWGRIAAPAIVVALIVGRWFLGGEEPPSRFNAKPIAPAAYQVERVVDGDTLIVLIDDAPGERPRRERVRLLGIDTPETVREGHPVEAWGPQASEFTREFVGGGRVRLEFDKRRVDRYGRHLAYVFVGDRMLNEALLAEGLARVSHFPGDNQSTHRRLRKAEVAAKAAGRGIWSAAGQAPR